MPTLTLEREFLKDQLTEIHGYIQQYQTKDANKAALHWIEEHATKYRKEWSLKHLHASV